MASYCDRPGKRGDNILGLKFQKPDDKKRSLKTRNLLRITSSAIPMRMHYKSL